MSFVASFYPEHYSTPIDILMWLYDMALYTEQVEDQKRMEAEMYSAPNRKAGQQTGKGKKGKK